MCSLTLKNALSHTIECVLFIYTYTSAKNKGLKVNYTDIAGRTPLHSAAQVLQFLKENDSFLNTNETNYIFDASMKVPGG